MLNFINRYLKKSGNADDKRPVQIFFTNTLSGSKEIFISHTPGVALMYTCGPTVYGPVHIGNLRAYVFSDTVARVLQAGGYRVRRVINITDFGHLVSDGDEGEDKMTKGLRREGYKLTLENMRTMAEKYAAMYLDNLSELNVDTSDVEFPRASDFIPEQIALIKTLEQKGYAYKTSDGVYFDTERFPSYGVLGDIDIYAQQEGARVKLTSEKHSPADFVLWKPDAHLGWQSPWGLGFPGWHTECSAMSRSLLGQELDIHTGGEDHVAVHHNNEIAQSEAASGRPFVRYWMHNAFLNIEGQKISKSLENDIYLKDVIERGYHPLTLRYFFLQAHYRTPVLFSWEALAASSAALTRLWKLCRAIADESDRVSHTSDAIAHFVAAMRDDLGTPQAIAVLWDSLKSEEYSPEEKWGLIEKADTYLGLMLQDPPELASMAVQTVPEELELMMKAREEARKNKDFDTADTIRQQIEERGYRVDDGPNGQVLTKRVI